MTIGELTRERLLGDGHNTKEIGAQYNLRDGIVHFGNYALKGADMSSFRWYLGGMAKDRKACYYTSQRLKGADPRTFRALNFSYCRDDSHIWTVSGRLATADPHAFEVSDTGLTRDELGPCIKYGYAKDAKLAYYYSFGSSRIYTIKKADPATFVSLGGNDGFAKDANHVYRAGIAIRKAEVGSWRPLGSAYSCDDKRVYFSRDVLKKADPATFAVFSGGPNGDRVARDGSRYFLHDKEIDAALYDQLCTGAMPWSAVPVSEWPSDAEPGAAADGGGTSAFPGSWPQ